MLRIPSAVGALVLALYVVVQPVHAAASLQSLDIQRADLSARYVLRAAQAVSNAQIAIGTKIPVAQFDRHGRITGYEEVWSDGTGKGAVFVIGSIYAYTSRAGAAWDYAHSVTFDRKLGIVVPGSTIGEASTRLIIHRVLTGQKYVNFVIDFRRGTYDLTIAITAPAGASRMAQTERIARDIDQRIRRAGSR